MGNGTGTYESAQLVGAAQRRIDRMLLRRASFNTIEDMIEQIDGLDLDQKAALWLYAWSHQPAAAQRSQARVTLAIVAR